MGWRRRLPLHERLAREGGLAGYGDSPPHDVTPRWGEVGIHGVSRPREWDAVVVVDSVDVPGERVTFTALPDGTLVVDQDVPEGSLADFADALERSVAPPYRAEAVRQDDRRWGVAARTIQVAELREDVGGETIELTARDGERSLVVDGLPSFGSVRELERLGQDRFAAYVVHAERIDGPFWEVRINPL